MFEGINLFEKSPFTSTSVVLAYLFVLLIPVMVFRFYKIWKSIQIKEIKLIWLVLAIFYIVVFIIVYPGFVSCDDIYTSAVVRAGKAFGWQSLTYSFILAVGQILLGGLGFTSLISILLFLYISLKIFSVIAQAEISDRSKMFLAAGLFFLALHPLNQGLLFFHCRDTLFSLLLFYLGFQVLEKYEWTKFKIIWFVVLLVLLGDLRQEAKIYLIIFPLIFYFLKKWKIQQIKIYFFSCVMLGYIYYNQLAGYFNAASYTYDYQVTAYVLPLSQIFHDKSPDQIPEEYKKNIEAVFNTQKLKKYFNPIDIDPFHRGGYNYNTTDEEWKRFKSSAQSLILENLDIFLKNRIYLFKSMLNIGHPPQIFEDELRRNGNPILDAIKSKLKLMNDSYLLGSVGETYRGALYRAIENTNIFNFLMSSFVFPILFLIICLFLIRYFPLVGCLALIIAIRLPVLFLLAPASYVKYIYSLFLFFTFVPAVLLVDLLSKEKRPSIKSSN